MKIKNKTVQYWWAVVWTFEPVFDFLLIVLLMALLLVQAFDNPY